MRSVQLREEEICGISPSDVWIEPVIKGCSRLGGPNWASPPWGQQLVLSVGNAFTAALAVSFKVFVFSSINTISSETFICGRDPRHRRAAWHVEKFLIPHKHPLVCLSGFQSGSHPGILKYSPRHDYERTPPPWLRPR